VAIFSRPACTLSPTLSRNLTGEGPDAGMPSTALAVGVYRQSRMGEGRVRDLGARRIFSALRRKILMSGAKNGRQAQRSHTPALSHPGEGVNPLVSALLLPGEKINSLESGHFSILSLYV